MMPLKLILITAIFCMLLVSSLQAEDHTQISAPTTFAIPEHLLQQVKSRYGAQAATRLRSWQQLIEHAANRREIEKLQMANNFINQAQFIDNSHLEDESLNSLTMGPALYQRNRCAGGMEPVPGGRWPSIFERFDVRRGLQA